MNIWNEKLNKETFLLYAARYYKGTQMWSSFFDDVRTFNVINRMITVMMENKDVTKSKIIMNEIIAIGNVYDVYPLNRLLFATIPEAYHLQLKTILYYIKKYPDTEFPEANIKKDDFDEEILNYLNTL